MRNVGVGSRSMKACVGVRGVRVQGGRNSVLRCYAYVSEGAEKDGRKEGDG